MDGSVCLIERDHIASANCPVTPLEADRLALDVVGWTSPKKIKRTQSDSESRRKQRTQFVVTTTIATTAWTYADRLSVL